MHEYHYNNIKKTKKTKRVLGEKRREVYKQKVKWLKQVRERKEMEKGVSA